MNDMWIENFEIEDRPIAIKLFNSLQFFDLKDIESEIYGIIKNSKLKINYGIYPVMDQKNIKKDINYLDLLKERTLLFKSKKDNFYNDADSEFVFMHFIRNYCNKESFLHNMPLRDTYKKLKIRGIIIITDLIASGRQTSDFVDYLIKDKTIKSYISFNKIEEIKVICHLATDQAIKKVHEKRIYSKGKIITIHSARFARTIDNYFINYDEKAQIVNLCKKYALNTKSSLGYNDTGLLSIYSHKTPNNIPGIISQNNNKWEGLIVNRRLKKNIIGKKDTIIINESEANILAAFRIIEKSNKNIVHRLSEFMGINSLQAKSIILTLRNAGYVSNKGYITYNGRKIFRKISKLDLNLNKIDKFVERVYYPFYKKRHST